jgi:hypothetical protein
MNEFKFNLCKIKKWKLLDRRKMKEVGLTYMVNQEDI